MRKQKQRIMSWIMVIAIIFTSISLSDYGTLKAYAKDSGEVELTFNCNGGNVSGEEIVKRKYTRGDGFGELPQPTRDGYEFSHWQAFYTYGGDSPIYGWDNCSVNIDEKKEIVAHWNKLRKPEDIITAKYYVKNEKGENTLYKKQEYTQTASGNFALAKEPDEVPGKTFLFWALPTGSDVMPYDYFTGKNGEEYLEYVKYFNFTYAEPEVLEFYAVYDTDLKLSNSFMGWPEMAFVDRDFTYIFDIRELKYRSTLEYDKFGDLINNAFFFSPYDIYIADRDGKKLTDDAVLVKNEYETNAIDLDDLCIDTTINAYKLSEEQQEKVSCIIFDYDSTDKLIKLDYARAYVTFDTAGLCEAPKAALLKDDEELKEPEAPKAKGYKFVGWYTEPELEHAIDFNDDGIKQAKGALTAYAKFEPLPKYAVTFDGNGGAMDGKATVEKLLTVDDVYGVLPTPVREGYKFLGWSLTKDGDKYITENTMLSEAKNHTLYASWEKEKKDPNPTPGPNPNPTPGPNPNPDGKIEIKFDPNGGTSDKDAIEIIPGKPGEMPKATKKNVVFGGWKDEKGNYVTDLSTLSGNAVLTASWENITVVAKQKMDIASFFADAKKSYIDKKKAETELAGKKFKEKNIKYRYRVLNKEEFDKSISMNSVQNSATQGKATVNGKGILNCKKSGLVALQLQFREKDGKKSKWIDAPGSDILFIAIEKPISVKNANKTFKYIGERMSISSLLGYEMSNEVGNIPNFAECTITSSKPLSVSVNALTGEIMAVANGKSKISLNYKTPIGKSKSGKVKYSTVKISFMISVKAPQFKKTEVNLKAGKSTTLKLKNVAKNTPITWSSDNESVATVTDGKVKAVGNGTATIKAIIDGRDYTCKVNVK